MSERTLPRACCNCVFSGYSSDLKTVYATKIKHTLSVKVGDTSIVVTIPDLPVERCKRCGNYTMGPESDDVITRATLAAVKRLYDAAWKECEEWHDFDDAAEDKDWATAWAERRARIYAAADAHDALRREAGL